MATRIAKSSVDGIFSTSSIELHFSALTLPQSTKGRSEERPSNPLESQVTAWTRSRIPRLPEEAQECTSSSCCGVPTRAGESTADTGQGRAYIRAQPAQIR